jgi:hypothetical protein
VCTYVERKKRFFIAHQACFVGRDYEHLHAAVWRRLILGFVSDAIQLSLVTVADWRGRNNGHHQYQPMDACHGKFP